MSAQQHQPQHPPTGRSQRSLPGYQQTPKPGADPDALEQFSTEEIETVALNLMELTYGEEGLTRDQIRKHYRDLPEAIYLRLPASQRFLTAEEALRAAFMARGRAEGDFLGAQPDIPEAESLSDGGPPAWGGDPLLTRNAVEEGGSAEDTQGLTSSESEEAMPNEARATDLDR